MGQKVIKMDSRAGIFIIFVKLHSSLLRMQNLQEEVVMVLENLFFGIVQKFLLLYFHLKSQRQQKIPRVLGYMEDVNWQVIELAKTVLEDKVFLENHSLKKWEKVKSKLQSHYGIIKNQLKIYTLIGILKKVQVQRSQQLDLKRIFMNMVMKDMKFFKG